DLQLDPGRVVSATVLDPEGKPLAGCRTLGTRSMPYWDRRPLDGSTFEVTALAPRQSRHLMVYHEGRRLGGSVVIGKDDEGPLTVRLQPCGVVTGRLLDDEGRPLTNLEMLNAGFRDEEPNEGVFHRRCPVDADGRFRIEVIPGVGYRGGVQKGGRIV